MLESNHATARVGCEAISDSSGDCSDSLNGTRLADRSSSEAYLRKVAATAIRLVRHEMAYARLLDDNITKHTTVPKIVKQWENIVAARRELKACVAELEGKQQ